ncbi:MAG: glycine zipper 2TM domain-containing protein [Gammaproteobacteria bacterium]|nr:glycine zipper 2TM domain-containing protein [Gammaproteobacteria bacterium]
MKAFKLAACSAILASATLVGCATNEEGGTVVGAGTGALVGYAIAPHSVLGPVIGAGAGAIVGNQVGRNIDRDQNYRHRYHHRQHYRYYED